MKLLLTKILFFRAPLPLNGAVNCPTYKTLLLKCLKLEPPEAQSGKIHSTEMHTFQEFLFQITVFQSYIVGSDKILSSVLHLLQLHRCTMTGGNAVSSPASRQGQDESSLTRK